MRRRIEKRELGENSESIVVRYDYWSSFLLRRKGKNWSFEWGKLCRFDPFVDGKNKWSERSTRQLRKTYNYLARRSVHTTEHYRIGLVVTHNSMTMFLISYQYYIASSKQLRWNTFGNNVSLNQLLRNYFSCISISFYYICMDKMQCTLLEALILRGSISLQCAKLRKNDKFLK